MHLISFQKVQRKETIFILHLKKPFLSRKIFEKLFSADRMYRNHIMSKEGLVNLTLIGNTEGAMDRGKHRVTYINLM